MRHCGLTGVNFARRPAAAPRVDTTPLRRHYPCCDSRQTLLIPLIRRGGRSFDSRGPASCTDADIVYTCVHANGRKTTTEGAGGNPTEGAVRADGCSCHDDGRSRRGPGASVNLVRGAATPALRAPHDASRGRLDPGIGGPTGATESSARYHLGIQPLSPRQ